jgi:hypothetical protein
MSQPSAMPLVREVIDIPDWTSTSDFVLQLADCVADSGATLMKYVVTDRLLGNFDEAARADPLGDRGARLQGRLPARFVRFR